MAGEKRVNRPAPLNYRKPIWFQQQGESDNAYKQFVAYRDSDPRRIRDHASGAHNSVRWSWRERCRAWDDHLLQREAERLVRYRVDMNERHRAVARLAMSRVAQWLQNIDTVQIESMKPNEVMKMLEVAAALERTAARGDMPDVTVGVTSNVVDMTAQATSARLDELMAEVQRRRAAAALTAGSSEADESSLDDDDDDEGIDDVYTDDEVDPDRYVEIVDIDADGRVVGSEREDG